MEKFSLRITVGIILILTMLNISSKMVSTSELRQEIVVQNAEVKNIKYGLLSVFSWKRQISEILTEKIRGFTLTTENRRELKESIENGMYKLLNQLDRLLEEQKRDDSWLERLVRPYIEAMYFSIDDLRNQVPQFTEIILNELDNPETRENLRIFVQQKVDELLRRTVGEEDLSKIDFIANKNGCSDIETCSKLLESKLNHLDNKLYIQSISIIGLSVLLLIVLFLRNKETSNAEYLIFSISCGILLYTGVNTPMIDIDARIENFSFLLMGEPINFSDQILFFQSKSIFEVVKILISTEDYQSIIVGTLIILFSVIFPVLKLMSSIGIIYNQKLHNNKVIHFLALKSSKWSMADVIVVAIFMAYIGFRGVIENQLRQLETISNKIEILTTDNSNFGVGFITFLAFCIGGLILATLIENRINKTEYI